MESLKARVADEASVCLLADVGRLAAGVVVEALVGLRACVIDIAGVVGTAIAYNSTVIQLHAFIKARVADVCSAASV
jgi:hypothetical protein